MTTIAPSPVPDKVPHLTRFIEAHLAQGADVSLIARSNDSPIALAIIAARETMVEKQANVRAVFMQSPPSSWIADQQLPDFRVALNPRLLEAHEQLVIGRAAVWIGDCMRRDPYKRDAFQQEKVACAVTSQFAAVSFERLWVIGTPVVPSLAAISAVPASPSRDVAG
jgi:hypothetical protein